MDLSAILNVEDVPIYQRPSSPTTDSSHGYDTPRTPGETSPVLSYGSRSPGSKRFKSEHKVPSDFQENTASPSHWLSSPFTAVVSTPSIRSQQLASVDRSDYGMMNKPLSSLYSPESPRAFSPSPLRVPTNGVDFPSPTFPTEISSQSNVQSATRPIKKTKRGFTQQSTEATPTPYSRPSPWLQAQKRGNVVLDSHSPGLYRPTHGRTRTSIASERLPGVAEILYQAMPGMQPKETIDNHAVTKRDDKAENVASDCGSYSCPIDAEDSDATVSICSDQDDSICSPPTSLDAQKCAFMAECPLNSPVRRVISHYFGRNKKETRAIPDDIWVNYCRQHYQRAKYRQKPEIFAETQMKLVKATVHNLQQWGGVEDFDISLRKRAVDLIAKEDAYAAAFAQGGKVGKPSTNPCEERWMQPYTGKNKSFAEVFALIDMVTSHSLEHKARATEFEVVPNIKPHLMNRHGATKRAPKSSIREPRPPNLPKLTAPPPVNKSVKLPRRNALVHGTLGNGPSSARLLGRR